VNGYFPTYPVALPSSYLTGLYNRRFLSQRLKEELDRAARHGLQVSAVMLDLDNFKAINDTYGHDAGDFVLERIGKIMRAAVRKYDIVGRNTEQIGKSNQYAVRFGGEEFCLVLLRTGDDIAEIIPERTRKNIEAYEFLYDGKCIKITVSCGICTGSIPKGSSPGEDLLAQFYSKADKALYEAKPRQVEKIKWFTSNPDIFHPESGCVTEAVPAGNGVGYSLISFFSCCFVFFIDV